MLTDFFMKLFVKIHVFLYSRSDGSIGGSIRGADVLLLTSLGRKSGKKRSVPLSYMEDGSNYVIVASYGGKDNNRVGFIT